MTALIVEDEPMAQRKLTKLLSDNFPEIRILGATDSVKGTVAYLGAHAAPDVIFMDVELSDGNCFEIFRKTTVSSHVIMTTAYDSYAVKAFEVNSLDYLLKPIGVEELRRSLERAAERLSADASFPPPPVASRPHRDRFLIRLNDRIVPVSTKAIAYFYSEAKNSYIVTYQGTSYVLDDSLDTIEQCLDPSAFFRISRSCIVSEDAIESISKLLGGRLRLSLRKGEVPSFTDFTVSRARVDAFMSWLER